MNNSEIGKPLVAAYEHKSGEARITEADIRGLIPAFYTKVRGDPVLGPVFERIVGDHWPTHVETVCSFWLSAARLDRSYNGRNFTPAHVKHFAVRAELLPRWLTIFRETAHELCPRAVALALIDIAERMAASLEISLTKRDDPARGPEPGT